MQAVIMAGGFGTRLAPLTKEIPKPMVKIIDKPIIERIVNLLKLHGFNDIIITLGYKPKCIIDYLGNGEKYGINISYSIEQTPLGTAGCVKNVFDRLEKTFLVISGDCFTNINLSKMVEFHLSHKKAITMAVKEVDDIKGFGVVKFDEELNVVDFVEKPKTSKEKNINTGIYVIEKKIMQNIPDGKVDFAKDFFPKVLDEMKVFETDDYWSDIGTLSSYYLTNNEVALNPMQFGITWWYLKKKSGLQFANHFFLIKIIF